jgi:RNA 2',3'-cyclic 3'-phosphodiesterase
MRLFVGLSIGSAVRDRIAECVDELRRRVEAHAARARISWVAADRLHITVRFIGEVDETEAQRIASSLAPVLRLAPFDVAFQGVGTFPDRGAPRVFWAGIGGGAEPLMSIEREVAARLVACGIDPERRDYRPHVTLARVREPAGLRGRDLLDGLADRTFGVSRVDAITLFQSRLSPRGSVYVPLQSTELRIR